MVHSRIYSRASRRCRCSRGYFRLQADVYTLLEAAYEHEPDTPQIRGRGKVCVLKFSYSRPREERRISKREKEHIEAAGRKALSRRKPLDVYMPGQIARGSEI